MTAVTDSAGRQVSGYRRTAFAVLSVLAGLCAAWNGLMGLAVSGFAAGNIHRVQQLGFGVFWAVAVAAALFLQARAPQRTALYQQLVAAAAALLAATALGRAMDATPLVMVVVLAGLATVHPTPRALLRSGRRPDALAAAFALAAAVPLVRYGLGQAAMEHTSAAGSPYAGQWTHMAAAAFAIPLVGLVSALRAPGWRISAWSAGLAAVLLGGGWLAFPDLASAPGAGWGVAAIAGGAVFIGLCARDTPRPSRVSASVAPRDRT